jgi:DNA-directed RNA polymerase subunit F
VEITDEEYVYPAEILDELKEKEEADEELTHEQKIALENLTRNIEIEDVDTLKELNDELAEVDALKQKHIYKILEVMPEQPSTVNTMFSKERVKLEDKDVEEILDICSSVSTE